MREPIDKKFSIINKHSKPEPGIVYTLPDGSTTIWLNEYVDAMVQAKVDEIVKMLEKQLAEQKVGMFYGDAIRTSIELVKGSNNKQ
jgi:hypothetical protein